MVENLELQKNIGKLRGCIREVLNEREWLIICKRYGLCGMEEKTQREIASSLGISRSYVSRLEKRALEKLRISMVES